MSSRIQAVINADALPLGELRRRLGETETLFHWARNRFHAFTICAVLRLRGEINSERMQQAIRSAICEDPYLTAMLRDGSSPEITLAISCPRIEIWPRHASGTWRDVMEDELNSPVLQSQDGVDAGQCRIILLLGDVEHELVLSVNHVVCDGETLKRLLAGILQHYSQTSSNTVPVARGLQPPYDQMKSFGHWLSSTLAFWRQSLISCRPRGKFRISPGDVATNQRDRTSLSFLQLPEDVSEKLFQRCRQQQLKVTTLLAAASFQAILECGYSSRTLQLQMNVDHRRLSGDSAPNTHGVASFWDLVRVRVSPGESLLELSRKLDSWVSTAGQRKFVPPTGYSRLVTTFLSYFAKNSEFSSSDVMLSNLGRLQLPDEELSVTGLSVATCQNYCGAVCGILATTVNQSLSLTIMTRRLVSHGMGQPIAMTLERILREFSA